jgi:hypothetical protein
MVENSKDLNSPKRHYILIPSGFYKARMAVEVDFFYDRLVLHGGLICVLNSQNCSV